MPRCLECEEKFEKKYATQIGKLRYCMIHDDCIKAFWGEANRQKDAKEQKEKNKRAKNKISENPEIYHSELKKEMQRWINNIARLIDKNMGCIDCDRKQSKQWDGGHRHSRGDMPSLRWNLHNIHNQAGYCNGYSEGNKGVYDEGIEEKYDKEYRELVESLPLIYPTLKLPNSELPEKLKIIREIYRELKKLDLVYPPKTRIHLREEYNNRIGIYL